jgi:hypothetical protein
MNHTIFSFWQMSDVDKANYLIENGQSSRDHLEALARKLANKAGDWHNCLPDWGSHQCRGMGGGLVMADTTREEAVRLLERADEIQREQECNSGQALAQAHQEQQKDKEKS